MQPLSVYTSLSIPPFSIYTDVQPTLCTCPDTTIAPLQHHPASTITLCTCTLSAHRIYTTTLHPHHHPIYTIIFVYTITCL